MAYILSLRERKEENLRASAAAGSSAVAVGSAAGVSFLLFLLKRALTLAFRFASAFGATMREKSVARGLCVVAYMLREAKQRAAGRGERDNEQYPLFQSLL